MSDFATLAAKPNTTKVLLFELDIGQSQEQWTNYQAHVWYINFDAVYPDLADWLKAGLEAVTISSIGSVLVDSVSIPSVASKSDVQGNDPSFHYSDDEKALYLRCPTGSDPHLRTVVIGLVWGFKKGGTRNVYHSFIYEDRLRSVPSLAKSKDPLFFGKIVFEGGRVEIDNADGEFDMHDLLKKGSLIRAMKQFFGGTPEEVPEVYRECSSVLRVHKNCPPMLFLHGTKDGCVSHEQSVAMVKRLNELNVPAEVEIYEGKPHAWFNRPADLEITMDRVEPFVEKHFKVERIKGSQ